jgi:hypothetical protein
VLLLRFVDFGRNACDRLRERRLKRRKPNLFLIAQCDAPKTAFLPPACRQVESKR